MSCGSFDKIDGFVMATAESVSFPFTFLDVSLFFFDLPVDADVPLAVAGLGTELGTGLGAAAVGMSEVFFVCLGKVDGSDEAGVAAVEESMEAGVGAGFGSATTKKLNTCFVFYLSTKSNLTKAIFYDNLRGDGQLGKRLGEETQLFKHSVLIIINEYLCRSYLVSDRSETTVFVRITRSDTNDPNRPGAACAASAVAHPTRCRFRQKTRGVAFVSARAASRAASSWAAALGLSVVTSARAIHSSRDLCIPVLPPLVPTC